MEEERAGVPAARRASCVVLMLGPPATGKRTVGGRLAGLLGGVLVDNALVNRPLLELLQWDGVAPLPEGFWDRVAPVRDAVMRTIEDFGPPTTSYVFTNVIEEGPGAAAAVDRIRSLADRRGALFLPVLLRCDIDVQVGRIATPDRIALRKGADPEGYRRYTLEVPLHEPPDAVRIDTTSTPPAEHAERLLALLRARGLDA